jgi:hypothetical protein
VVFVSLVLGEIVFNAEGYLLFVVRVRRHAPAKPYFSLAHGKPFGSAVVIVNYQHFRVPPWR